MKNTVKINLENLFKGMAYKDRCSIANNDYETSSYELDMLVDLLDEKEDDYNDNFLINKITENRNTSAETLDKLLKLNNTSYEIPLSIANHKNASAETLDILSTYRKFEYIDSYTCSVIRHCVANNKNTSAQTLDKLSKDEDSMVREYVARNENTTAETLDRLSKDENSTVRYCVSKNKNTSAETLDRMQNVA